MDIGDPKTNPKEASKSSSDYFENRMMKNFGSIHNQNPSVSDFLESSQKLRFFKVSEGLKNVPQGSTCKIFQNWERLVTSLWISV